MFLKYPSIENTYREKNLAYWLELYPELREAEYVLQEKLHGANIQFIFLPEEDEVVVASRKRIVPVEEDFYGVRTLMARQEEENGRYVMSDLQLLFYHAHEWARENEVSLRLYGEIFGDRVQGGTKYGTPTAVRFFDMAWNDEMVSQEQLTNWMWGFDADSFLVPSFGVSLGLEVALKDADGVCATKTQILGGEGEIEGVVIKPLREVYKAPTGSTFYLKHKNPKFAERTVKIPRVVPEEVKEYSLLFEGYITEKRVQAVFSKHGQIESKKQIGEYIRLVVADAKEDFLKDVTMLGVEKADMKKVFGKGKQILDILNKYL